MKTIRYKNSKFSDTHHLVNISDKHPTWYYTYEMSIEGFVHFLSICRAAGYEIIEESIETT